ncbi:MAG: hypothetical protein AABW99_03700 [archaeon]
MEGDLNYKIIIGVLLVSMVFVFGCTSGNNNGQQNQGTGDNTTGGTQTGGTGGTQTGGTQTGGTQGGNALEDFLGLVDLQKSTGFKVVYDITSTSQGKTNPSSEMAQYYKYPKIRTDATATTEGQTFESRIFYTISQASADMISCTKLQGNWSCFELNTPATGDATNAAQNIQDNPSDYTIVADGTISLAGATANCFKAISTPQNNGGTNRFCYTSDGIPLYMKVTGAQGFEAEMKAKSFSKGVSDADFVPPATPGALPGLPTAGGGLPNIPSGANIPGYPAG